MTDQTGRGYSAVCLPHAELEDTVALLGHDVMDLAYDAPLHGVGDCFDGVRNPIT